MRSRKYSMSERAASLNSLAAAHVISLDIAHGRVSKMSEAGDFGKDRQVAPTRHLSARKSHESAPGVVTDNQLKSSKRWRLTAADLQKLLYSTDVAKILLDIDLNIRFFTPAAKLILDITPDYVGRSLEELNYPASYGMLMNDARRVLRTLETIEREIDARGGLGIFAAYFPIATRARGLKASS
jgi:hypothetical protein